MSRLPYHRSALALLVLSGFVLACSDDTSLGAPDGARCTVGSISVGDTVTGEVTAESCLLWNDYDYEESNSESWTLRTAPDKVYIVRMTPVAVDGGANTFDGDLYVFGRNEAGDAIFLSGRSGSYGPVNVNGGSSRELILPSRRAMTLSVRVSDEGAFGAYRLTVDECPLLALTIGNGSAAVEHNNSCATYSLGSLNPTPAAFFSYDAEAGVTYNVVGTRAAGTATFAMVLRGPGVDFGCYLADCTAEGSASGAGPLSILNQTAEYSSDYTVMTYPTSAGALSTSMSVSEAPIMLSAPSSLKR